MNLFFIYPRDSLCAVDCVQFLVLSIRVWSLFVIECKVKGTQWRDGGAAVNWEGDCYCAQGHTRADGHHIEISKWTAECIACCPICGPLPPGDIPTHPVMGHHCVSWAAGWGFGGWAGLGVVVGGDSWPPHCPKMKRVESYLFTACFALVP